MKKFEKNINLSTQNVNILLVKLIPRQAFQKMAPSFIRSKNGRKTENPHGD
jgi:hypothetical protein